MKKPKKQKYYISNEELIKEFIILKEDDVITNQLAQYVLRIIEGIAYSPNFINYSFKDDMRGDATLRVMKSLRDPKFLSSLKNSNLEEGILRNEKNEIMYMYFFIDETDTSNKISEKEYNLHIDDENLTLKKEEDHVEKLLDDNEKIIYIKRPKKFNFFNYLSSIIWNEYANRIKKEKKYQVEMDIVKDKIFENYVEEYGICIEKETGEDNDY